LPDLTTWYLVTNLSAAGQGLKGEAPFPPASLEELVRLYGLRTWVEQSYKHVKHALGWSQYQVRSDQAIRRHWQLVCCAFSLYIHLKTVGEKDEMFPRASVRWLEVHLFDCW
jgi:hypothetical protein